MKLLKNKLFWLIDALKGSPIKNELNEITNCLNQTSYLSLKEKNLPKLELLLKAATKNSAFYKNYKSHKNLDEFPVINKSIIKSHSSDFLLSKISKKKLIKVSTSGSTGTPFTIYQNKKKKVRNTADTLYFGSAAGFTIGDQLLYLRSWMAYSKKKAYLAKLLNIQQLDVSDLNDDSYMKNLIKKLQKDKSSKSWIGYASGFETICRYLETVNSPKLNCNIKSIIAISENLSPKVKEKMTNYFQCPTVSRYSNVENGIIAQQLPNDEYFTINWASYIVEILDLEEDKAAKDGDIGRIVVTDLYNLVTPFIRYDTGDIGAFTVSNDNDAIPKLRTIQGRKMDVLYTTKGELVNPFIMSFHVDEFQEIDQIQYIQIANKKYVIKINTKKNFLREEELVNLFRDVVGKDASIKLEYVDEIPALKSGKRKLTINKLLKP